MGKPGKRLEARGSAVLTAHGSIIFWKISHSYFNGFPIKFNLATVKL